MPNIYNLLFQENPMKIAMLEKLIKDQVAREMRDIRELESQMGHHMNLIQEKKRQLEIKKRKPVECFFNIVSCWKK